MNDDITIRNEALAARFALRGAELQSLVPAGGAELIWSGDHAVWPWHAPNLFPIVGALADDTLVHRGASYPMKRHGFLRESLCTVDKAVEDAVVFRLVDSDATRAHYPFRFELLLRYRLAGERLETEFVLSNPDTETLPAMIGGHTAFRWPIEDGVPKQAHVVLFDMAEPEPIRRLDGNLLAHDPIPTPVEGKLLRLSDALFNADALIFDRLRSRRVSFGAPSKRGVAVEFADFPWFGIWSKPGPFLCLEPWQGHASPKSFAGEFLDKPGNALLAPGETRRWRYAITPLAVMPD